ncbi:hypothetical protein KFU94_43455 [Chloroflexi bacterium TSY]|nr:hypothetical protein [Chloroflexi bacterium TSY]
MTITDMAWIGLLTSILIGGYVVPLIQRRRQDGQQEHHEEVDVRQSPSGRRNYEGKVPPTQPTTVNVTTQPIRHQIPRTWVSSHPYYPRAIRRHVVKMAPPKPVSLWQERGWKQQRGWWEGTYVVNGRRWRGRAQTMLGGSLSFYIHKPPTPLLRGKHGACYVHKGKDKGYFVHFDPKKPRNLSQGIGAIECQLAAVV